MGLPTPGIVNKVELPAPSVVDKGFFEVPTVFLELCPVFRQSDNLRPYFRKFNKELILKITVIGGEGFIYINKYKTLVIDL